MTLEDLRTSPDEEGDWVELSEIGVPEGYLSIGEAYVNLPDAIRIRVWLTRWIDERLKEESG